MTTANDFSVLISVYKNDNPQLFRNALHSIASNSIRPKQVVLVGDGELPGDILNVIIKFDALPLRFIPLVSNVGLARALNYGLKHVDTEFVLRADADDINYPQRFELILEKLREGYDVVGSAIREVDQNGVEIAFRTCPLTEAEIRQFIKRRNPFNHMSVGFRTSTICSAGGYPNIFLKEDYALWAVLLSRNAKVCNLPVVLVDASAGEEMFKRRGGIRYALAEVDLQFHLVRCGVKSKIFAVIDGVLRATVFLAPGSFRAFFYLRFLRERRNFT